MDRRTFLRAAAGAAAGLAALPAGTRGGGAARIPCPRAAQLAWQEAELGVVFHYDLHVFDGKRYRQGANQRTPIPDIDIFHPTRLDTDQWMESAKGMGARFAILTASHETGFRLWPSDANPYSTKALEWRDGRGDVVREFVESCRRQDIRPGIYLGARWNSHLGVLSFKVTDRSPLSQARYNALIEREVEEICSRYGPLFELWFDGGILSPDKGGPDVLPIFEKHQPDCLFYHSDQRRDARWGGSESGTVPYPCWATTRLEKIATGRNDAEAYRYMRNGDPDGPDWCPAMSDAPLRGAHGRHEWFWEPGDEGAIQPLDALVDMYYRSVGHNSTLILGLTPDPEGRMPDADTRRCEEFGDEIRRRFARPIAQTSGEGDTVSLDLPRPARIDHVICREDIRHGQRARAYVVEGLAPGNEWRKLCEGSSIGQKRIQRFEPVEVARIRLRVTRSIATPKIRLLAVHAAG